MPEKNMKSLTSITFDKRHHLFSYLSYEGIAKPVPNFWWRYLLPFQWIWPDFGCDREVGLKTTVKKRYIQNSRRIKRQKVKRKQIVLAALFCLFFLPQLSRTQLFDINNESIGRKSLITSINFLKDQIKSISLFKIFNQLYDMRMTSGVMKHLNLLEHPGPGVPWNLLDDLNSILEVCPNISASSDRSIGALT